jgi:hypothetical protein
MNKREPSVPDEFACTLRDAGEDDEPCSCPTCMMRFGFMVACVEIGGLDTAAAAEEFEAWMLGRGGSEN